MHRSIFQSGILIHFSAYFIESSEIDFLWLKQTWDDGHCPTGKQNDSG